MDPQTQFCPNMACPARGQTGAGNIQVHSQQEQRYRCTRCGKTFSESKGTALYKLKKEPALFVTVTTLLAYGCPTKAIVAAYELDERTVRQWLVRSGGQCQRVHAEIVGKSKLDLEQVQADEIKAKTQGGTVWMAMALMVRTYGWVVSSV